MMWSSNCSKGGEETVFSQEASVALYIADLIDGKASPITHMLWA